MAALIRDGLNQLGPDSCAFWDSDGGWVVFILLFLLLLLIFLPPLMKTWWRCRPLDSPSLPLLQQTLTRSRVKIDKICLWPALNRRALTAAMLGFIPGLRYLLITPALLDNLSPNQLAAVTAHEAGHIRCRHALIYIFVLGGYFLLAWALSEPINTLINLGLYALASTPSGADFLLHYGSWKIPWRILLSLPMLLLLLLYLRLVLGFFMRQSERQADFFALDIMNEAQPLAGALERLAALSGPEARRAPSWHHFSIEQRAAALLREIPGQAALRQGRLLRRCLLVLGAAILLTCGLNLALTSLELSSGLRRQALEHLEKASQEREMQWLNENSL
jgi:Zn-dependent protease with chaperone function